MTPAFSWTRSFQFIFSFFRKRNKNVCCFLEPFDLRSEGRISVQNAVKLPWNEDYYYYLVFSHQTLVPIVLNRKVFDHIQLGVHNPADTVSAPDSIALFCHVFWICSLISFEAPVLETSGFESELCHPN